MMSIPAFLNAMAVSHSFAGLALLYLGPDTIMPIASMLAALLGVLLIAWRYIWGFLKKSYRFVVHKVTHTPMNEPAYVETQNDENDEIHDA